MAEWENLSIKLGVNNMASLKCSQCGFGIHYHDEPNGVELTAIPLDTWKKFFLTDKPIVRYNLDGPQDYLIIWKCPQCQCFHIFMGSSTIVKKAYALNSEVTNFINGIKYIIFNDYDFDDISEKGLTATDYKKCQDDYNAKYLVVNENYLYICSDINFQNIEKIYKAIENM